MAGNSAVKRLRQRRNAPALMRSQPAWEAPSVMAPRNSRDQRAAAARPTSPRSTALPQATHDVQHTKAFTACAVLQLLTAAVTTRSGGAGGARKWMGTRHVSTERARAPSCPLALARVAPHFLRARFRGTSLTGTPPAVCAVGRAAANPSRALQARAAPASRGPWRGGAPRARDAPQRCTPLCSLPALLALRRRTPLGAAHIRSASKAWPRSRPRTSWSSSASYNITERRLPRRC
jgi:hypothetical protein